MSILNHWNRAEIEGKVKKIGSK